MSELDEKVKTSIERLKAFEPKNGEGYYLAFSGGKDSVVCKALMEMAGVKYDATYRVTSVDPPELVRFIKEKHPDVKREIPHDKDGKPITMWNLIPRKLMPPTRIVRYCCDALKESAADVREVLSGKDVYYTQKDHCEFKCSVCGAWAGSVAYGTLDGAKFNFCPNCGAKMEVGD